MKYAIPQDSIKNWTAQREKFQQISQADRAKLLGLRRRFIKALHDAGVPFALGSDAPQLWNVPGFLRIASSVARRCRADAISGAHDGDKERRNVFEDRIDDRHDCGRQARGSRAPDANPLTNIDNSTRIAGVMVNGRWIPKAIDNAWPKARRVRVAKPLDVLLPTIGGAGYVHPSSRSGLPLRHAGTGQLSSRARSFRSSSRRNHWVSFQSAPWRMRRPPSPIPTYGTRVKDSKSSRGGRCCRPWQRSTDTSSGMRARAR